MPHDQYTPFYGHLCLKCGQEERQQHFKWCASCIARPRRQREAQLAASAAEAQRWVSPVQPAPPPPAVGRPDRNCPRCGPTVWLDLGSNVWHCRSCGFDPALPDGPRRMTWLYEEPAPAPPAPVPTCQVCGPTTWQPRDDGSQQCRLCGAVRS
jgi:ribosomal protein L37AE/L43A